MNQLSQENKSTVGGLHLVRKPIRRAEPLDALREGSTGRVVVHRIQYADRPKVLALRQVQAAAEEAPRASGKPEVSANPRPEEELAFYRKYTEALLRRYLRLSMQCGRVPSLMSRDLFRGHVTRYSVRGFEEVVIFCHDVEQRLARLNYTEQQLIKRVVLQQYTRSETAGILGMSLRTCIQRYGRAVDRLTGLLLQAGLLEPQRR